MIFVEEVYVGLATQIHCSDDSGEREQYRGDLSTVTQEAGATCIRDYQYDLVWVSLTTGGFE